MEATGMVMNCCNATSFESCTIRLVERIGVVLMDVLTLMLTLLGFNLRVFAIGDQTMPDAVAMANKWITFLFLKTSCKEPFLTSLVF